MWTSTWPLSTLPKHLIQSVMGTLENYGKSWLSCQIHSNASTVPRSYSCKTKCPKWVFWSIPGDKRCRARLLASTLFSTYLGSTLSRVVRGSIWDRSGIRLDTKLKVHIYVVLPTLLYVCETSTVNQRHAKRLNHIHTSCLRKLLKIKWQDRISDTEVLNWTGMQSVHTLLKLA